MVFMTAALRGRARRAALRQAQSRPRAPAPPAWRPGTAARFPGSSELTLPAWSSTRAKSSPRNSSATRSSASTGASILGRGAVHGQQSLAGGVDAGVERVLGRERLVGRRPVAASARVVAARRSPASSCRVCPGPAAPAASARCTNDVEHDAVGGQRRIARGGRGRAEVDAAAIGRHAGQQRRAAVQRGQRRELAFQPAVAADLQLARPAAPRRSACGRAGPDRPARFRPATSARRRPSFVQRDAEELGVAGRARRKEDDLAAAIDERLHQLGRVARRAAALATAPATTSSHSTRRQLIGRDHLGRALDRRCRARCRPPVAAAATACGSSATMSVRRGGGSSNTK